jgi:hypothetical protein
MTYQIVISLGFVVLIFWCDLGCISVGFSVTKNYVEVKAIIVGLTIQWDADDLDDEEFEL